MTSPALRRQRGMTLIVALVMLVMITLLAMSTFNLGKSSIQVVNNMQNRDEGIAASRRVLDEAMSGTRFFETPEDALANPCANSNQRCHDINGDATTDIVTTLSQPSCVKARSIKSTELDLSNTEDQGCSLGTQQGGFGMAGSSAVTGNSMCADTTWEMMATSQDQLVQSKVDVVQGVGVRVSSDAVDSSCK
jgi:type II secretory pathway pseudopilin PulG